MIIVLDTNVCISALLNPSGAPSKIVEAAIAGRVAIVTTSHLWEEFLQALSYDKSRLYCYWRQKFACAAQDKKYPNHFTW